MANFNNANDDSLDTLGDDSLPPTLTQDALAEIALDQDVFSEAEEAGFEDEEAYHDITEEEDDGEDLFGVNAERDYEVNPDLDRYDPELLDDSGGTRDISAAARRRAEREMGLRDRERRQAAAEGAPARQAARYYGGLEELLAGDEVEEEEEQREKRRRRESLSALGSDVVGRPLPRQIGEAKDELPYCDASAEWTERVAEIIKILFQGFIWHFTPDNSLGVPNDNLDTGASSTPGTNVGHYIEKISEMVREEGTSLHVSWNDLSSFSAKLTDWLVLHPTEVLNLFNLTASETTASIFPALYKGTSIIVRLTEFTGYSALRDLRTDCLNQFAAVEGVCIRRTNVLPQMKLFYLECLKCGCDLNGPFEKKANDFYAQQNMRRKCQDCQSNGPFIPSRENTVYENFQRITIQEPPSMVKPGHVPRQRKVNVHGDLVDTLRPGDEVVVTGVFQTMPAVALNAKSGFPIFETQIVANNIQRKGDIRIQELTEQDFDLIKRLSRNKMIREKLIDSIAPSIWGHRHVKTALAYALFGAVRRSTAAKHNLRGDINVLLLGDPGTAKSQFLKYVEKSFERTVYTTGKGASAVGLTAAVKRDPMTGEWSLEGGALVIADEGICLIDEFDKMSDKDRVSIHEAMEQQSISISKAGLVATLRARCSIIAAANPIFGRYDNSLTFSENVDLSDPMLSRFDVLAVIKDEVNPIQDEALADYVITSHMRSHPDIDLIKRADLEANALQQTQRRRRLNKNTENDWVTGSGLIPNEVLKKYIFYARKNCFPEIRSADQTKLADFYSQIRQTALKCGGLPMTVRHLESMIRMATANAKMRLSRYVEKRDFDFAISTMLESFIQSQKYAVAANLSRRFGRYRALASTPFEFLENLIIDVLSRKGRSAFLRESATRRIRTGAAEPVFAEDGTQEQSAGTGATGEFSAVDVQHFADAETTWTTLKTLAKTLYDIPETAVQSYIQSDRFKSKFQLRRESDDWVISRVRREFDASSQGSQESQDPTM